MSINEIGLRERKQALKKIEILNIVLNKIKEKPFSEISVKEIANDAMISEGTFFNYFTKKNELLDYFVILWSYQSYFLSNKEFGNTSGLKKIEYFFQCSVNNKTIGNDRIMYEIIANAAIYNSCDPFDSSSVTETELMTAFPDLPGIEKLQIKKFTDIFIEYIGLAVQLGELPNDVDYMNVLVFLGSIFYGVPLILKHDIEKIPYVYNSALNSIWKGISNR